MHRVTIPVPTAPPWCRTIRLCRAIGDPPLTNSPRLPRDMAMLPEPIQVIQVRRATPIPKASEYCRVLASFSVPNLFPTRDPYRSPISSVPSQSVARYTAASQDYSQLYPQSNDRAPVPPSTSHAAVYMPYHGQQQQREEYDDSQPPLPPTVVPSMSRPSSYHQAHSQHPQGYHQYATPTNATAEYPFSSSRYQPQGAQPQQVSANHQNSHPQMYLSTAPATEYQSANASHEGSPAMRGQAAVFYTHHNSPALRHAVPQSQSIVQQDQYYPQSRPVTAHGHQESPQQSLVLPPIRQQYTSAPASVAVSALPVIGTGMPAMGWDRVAVSDARVGR